MLESFYEIDNNEFYMNNILDSEIDKLRLNNKTQNEYSTKSSHNNHKNNKQIECQSGFMIQSKNKVNSRKENIYYYNQSHTHNLNQGTLLNDNELEYLKNKVNELIKENDYLKEVNFNLIKQSNEQISLIHNLHSQVYSNQSIQNQGNNQNLEEKKVEKENKNKNGISKSKSKLKQSKA